ncbi:MAG TPA: RNA 2',3'-cyclic phosphodiesterase [Methanomassiliicoccales archaeon]|nr:RNA 2',3'-cyclic phosphodiesterase [Methanomassiliicoccales archaeon]
MMSFRSFIAVDVECGEVLRDAINELQHFGRTLKPVSPDNLHVTLKFLGDTDERCVPQLKKVMKEAVKDVTPFDVKLVGTGAFPNSRTARVIWVGMEGAEPFQDIVTKLEDGCDLMGFGRDKQVFSPHLTLARVREGFNADLGDFIKYGHEKDFGSFTVKSLKLKKSVLTPEGPVYSDMAEVRF